MISEPLPSAFLDDISQWTAFSGLPGALCAEPEVSVRLNPAKTSAVLTDPVPWAPGGYYLPDRPVFTFDPALHQGLYYVQDASSMGAAAAVARAAALIGTAAPLRFLDACAAPGGKTIGAASALPEGTFIVANEYTRARVPILVENIAKWGTFPAVVTSSDASSISDLDGFFDIIAADVPCSGEGMMRKDAEARRQWSPSLVRECAALQSSIVRSLWQALRPGGFLVYSTCTFNRFENEEIVGRLIDECGAEPVAVPALDTIPAILGPVDAAFPAYRFLPGRIRGEGLFLALLRKPGETATARVKPMRPARPLFPAAASWLRGDWAQILRSDTLHLLPQAHMPLLAAIERRMKVAVPGVEAGIVKGRDLIPSQPVALSTYLTPGAFPTVEVTPECALAYLRRDTVTLTAGAPRGIILLTHNGAPLGFVKNLGNRANNLYPASWRILAQTPSAHTIL